jgi:NAD(P)-dependent dehydrogenase (short-subunit alcohol dehydrogenase family)
MIQDLLAKRALITGSSAGIGEATARMMAEAGARVFVHGRDQGRTEAVARAIGAPFQVADLAKSEEAEALIAAVNKEFGGLDILVNNAGGESSGGGNAKWFEATPDIWLKTYNANLISAIRLIHAFAPGMKERGFGRIINIGSGVAHTPQPTIPDYAGAKAAMTNSTMSLAKALTRTGVTANIITPGLIATWQAKAWLMGLADKQGWGDDWDVIDRKAATKVAPNLAGRLGRPEDIARAVMFFASPAADYVTGVELRMDGGQP